MKKFIAYFSYLGFKAFIENNSSEEQIRILKNTNFLDVESALKETIRHKRESITKEGKIDLPGMTINANNFINAVVFWTKDDSMESLANFLSAVYCFNLRSVVYTFSVRGAIVYDELLCNADSYENKDEETRYSVNFVFGKGLVRAHEKAEAQDWAGTVLDETFVDFIAENHDDPGDLFYRYSKPYQVPYKENSRFYNSEMEYVLRLSKDDLEGEALKNRSESIRKNFAKYNKPVNNPDIQRKLQNTINFL